ncbi:hypothetical protein OHT76_43950 [Streptomyces sp. NBC_00287]|uniref:hypothetical protein n=1 Tax=Streptomyces sp. NBC_00287 TaxID=2975702 RepID=UPI002E2C6949|nr:hypothetical protein [Streptomyces sp. NBC_00287]
MTKRHTIHSRARTAMVGIVTLTIVAGLVPETGAVDVAIPTEPRRPSPMQDHPAVTNVPEQHS